MYDTCKEIDNNNSSLMYNLNLLQILVVKNKIVEFLSKFKYFRRTRKLQQQKRKRCKAFLCL